jgi:hypothetical protein
MPIDDRLRSSLHWDPNTSAADAPDRLDMVVERATRRRRVRVALVGLTVAAAALLVAVAGPWAISRSQRGSEPVQQPNHSTHWSPTIHAGSPVDEHWEGSSGSRPERLAALDGTGLEGYGPAIYAHFLAHATLDLQFANGTVNLSTSTMGSAQFLGAHDYKASLHGTYNVRGHTLSMRFDEVPGTTVFRWSRVDHRTGEHLQLTFISTSAGMLYGAPAEVFFRLWSSQPFSIWGCC